MIIVAGFRQKRYHRTADATAVGRLGATYDSLRRGVEHRHFIDRVTRTTQLHGHPLAAPRLDRIFSMRDACVISPDMVAVAAIFKETTPMPFRRVAGTGKK